MAEQTSARTASQTRRLVKFWLDCAQVFVIIAAVLGTGITYCSNQESRLRELRKPYDERQIDIYGKAGAVMGVLATTSEQKNNETFWRIYYGEMPTVQTSAIARIMNRFCIAAFGRDGRCYEVANEASDIVQNEASRKTVMNEFAKQVQFELKCRWDSTPSSVQNTETASCQK